GRPTPPAPGGSCRSYGPGTTAAAASGAAAAVGQDCGDYGQGSQRRRRTPRRDVHRTGRTPGGRGDRRRQSDSRGGEPDRASAHYRRSHPGGARRIRGSGQRRTASGRCAGRAEKLDREIEARRGEMFGDLERQRDDLTAAVASLRNFETAYRTNLTSH